MRLFGNRVITWRIEGCFALVLSAFGVCTPLTFDTTADTPRRFGLTKGDEFRLCATKVFGKPVLAGVDTVVSCPESKENLLKELEAKDVAVLQTDEWIYLYPSSYARMAAHPRPFPSGVWSWKELKISTRVETIADKSTSARLNEIEINQYGKQIRLQTRSAPVVTPLVAGPDHVTAEIAYVIALARHRLGPSLPEAIVALAGGNLSKRLIYGEIHDGLLQIRWESPVLHGGGTKLEYVDVNADGVEEIIVKSTTGSRPISTEISIFDKDGNELTRDADRPTCEDDSTCPLGGEIVELVDGENGTKNISIPENSEFGLEGSEYGLKQGKYVLLRAFPAPIPVPPGVRFNEDGMQLMRAKNYKEAATNFVEAAKLMPSSALFANNAAFAYYKLERYEESVNWCERAIEIDPKRAVAYVNLGDAYVKLNRNAEARRAYTKYLELAPNSKSAPDVKKKLDALPPSP